MVMVLMYHHNIHHNIYINNVNNKILIIKGNNDINTYFNVTARSNIVSAVRPKHFSFQYKHEYIFDLIHYHYYY